MKSIQPVAQAAVTTAPKYESIGIKELRALQVHLGIKTLKSHGRFTQSKVQHSVAYCSNTSIFKIIIALLVPIVSATILNIVLLCFPLASVSKGYWANFGAFPLYSLYGATIIISFILIMFHHYFSTTPYIPHSRARDTLLAFVSALLTIALKSILASYYFPLRYFYYVSVAYLVVNAFTMYAAEHRLWTRFRDISINTWVSVSIMNLINAANGLGYAVLLVYMHRTKGISSEGIMLILVLMKHLMKQMALYTQRQVDRPSPILAATSGAIYNLIYVSFSFQETTSYYPVVGLILANSISNILALRFLKQLTSFRKAHPKEIDPGVICLYIEDIMLTEYAEATVPVLVMCLMTFLFYLSPQKNMYPFFRDGYTEAELHDLLLKLTAVAAIEFLWFFSLAYSIYKQLKIPAIRRLAFLLHEDRWTVSSAFMMGAIATFLNNIEHDSVDWTFST